MNRIIEHFDCLPLVKYGREHGNVVGRRLWANPKEKPGCYYDVRLRKDRSIIFDIHEDLLEAINIEQPNIQDFVD